jgi:hypothetical protein
VIDRTNHKSIHVAPIALTVFAIKSFLNRCVEMPQMVKVLETQVHDMLLSGMLEASIERIVLDAL